MNNNTGNGLLRHPMTFFFVSTLMASVLLVLMAGNKGSPNDLCGSLRGFGSGAEGAWGPHDFRCFYRAGVLLRKGESLDLYDSARYPQHLPFIRAPWQALEFAPFTFLRLRPAFLLWLVIMALFLAASVWRLRRPMRQVIQGPSLPRLLALALLPIPGAYMFLWGQDTAVFLFFLVCGLEAVRDGRDLDAGIWLGLASIDLHFLLPVFALLMLRRRWRILQSALAMGSVLFLTSTAVAGPHWLAACFHAQQQATGLETGALTVRALLWQAGLGRLQIPILLGGILASFWLVRRLPTHRACAWLVVSALAFNWHSLIYDYVAALPAAAAADPRRPSIPPCTATAKPSLPTEAEC